MENLIQNINEKERDDSIKAVKNFYDKVEHYKNYIRQKQGRGKDLNSNGLYIRRSKLRMY